MTIDSGQAHWLRRSLAALVLSFACAGSANAGVEACLALQTQFSPNDVSLAYQFVTEHGQCIAKFEDPVFQGVAGTLTSLTVSGALKPGQCGDILNNPNAKAAQQLLALADGGVVSSYLDCGCAVADSGVAQKIKDLVEDLVSCAKTFDVSGSIQSGVKKAGEVLGLSTLWGLAGEDHDPRAGVGNGGAPTYNYDVPMCTAVGVPFNGSAKAWDGSWLQPGQRIRTCNCPEPTRVYADFKFITGPIFHSPTFMCLVCGPGTAKDKYGNCSQCMNKSGPNGFETWAPNQDGSACVLTHVEPVNPCQKDQPWNGLGGSAALCCATWQALSPDKSMCTSRCPVGRIWDGSDCTACPPDTEQIENSCQACPAGSHSNYAQACVADACPEGLGLLPGGNECMVCPPDTERKQGGVCQPCTQGGHSDGGNDFCKIMGFGGVSCPAGTVHPPGDAVSCVCAPGTQEVNGVCQSVMELRPVVQPILIKKDN